MPRSKQELRELAGLSKDPWRFYPEWKFEDRAALKWQNLKRTHEAGRAFAEDMRAFAAELEGDDVYKPEAAARLKAEHFAEVIAPKFQKLRDEILSDLRREARTAEAVAEREALKLPETRFEVAASMRALDRVYHGVKAGGGSKKLRLPDLEQLEPEVRRAIAAAPRIASGLDERAYEIIRQKVFAEEGGKALADARELLEAVEVASEALDYGQVVAEIEAGIPNRSPEVEQRFAAVQ